MLFHLTRYTEQKFNVKRYPAKYQAAALKKEPWKRLSSFFHRSKDDQDSPKEEQTAIQRQFLRKVNYASELASALQKLFKATDLVHTIRLVQPEGYNSEYDIVYPSVYARVLVRLLTAIQFVDLPEGTILALMDLPITHLEEAGLHLDSRVALNSLSKFGSIFLRTRRMGYAVIPPGSQKYTQESFDPHIRIASSSLGMQLIRGIGANSTQFQSLTLVDCTKTVVLNVLLAPSQWETLRHLEIEHFCAIPDLFVPFMQNVLPHLETLSLQSVQLQPSALCPVTWISLFDSWVKLKEEMDAVHKWYLRTCYFAYLSPIPFVGSLSHEKIMHYVRILVVNKYAWYWCKIAALIIFYRPNEKPRLAVSEGAS